MVVLYMYTLEMIMLNLSFVSKVEVVIIMTLIWYMGLVF